VRAQLSSSIRLPSAPPHQRTAASFQLRTHCQSPRYGGGVPIGTRQVKRRNHTVNGSYLARFADDRGLLAGIELPGRRFPVPVDRATVVRNFYVTRLPDGSESDQAEDDFCDIEGRASASMTILIDQRRWPIPDAVRADIATWTALQFLRVPAVRQLAHEITGAYIDVGVPITTGTGEQIRLRMPAGEADPEKLKRLHLEFIRKNTPAVARMLHDRDWHLTFFTRKTLIAADSPVVLRPMLRYPAGTSVAVGDAAEVQVPLDRRAALSMRTAGRGDQLMPGSAKIAADLNQAVTNNARRFLFHHPSDDPLAGLALPPPRPRELSSSEAAAVLASSLWN
jgi:Protein of unknown function (DUF4238)